MATSERESVRPSFGIAHATVVPENFEPGRSSGGTDESAEGETDGSAEGETDESAE